MRIFLLFVSALIFLHCASSSEKTEKMTATRENERPDSEVTPGKDDRPVLLSDSFRVVRGSLGTPERVEGEIAVFEPDDVFEEKIISVLADRNILFRLGDPASEVSIIKKTTDDLGFVHLTLNRLHKGIPIWGEELLFHIDRQNVLYLYTGHYHPSLGTDFSTSPALSPEQAEKIAGEALGLLRSEARETRLIIYTSLSSPILAYRTVIGRSAAAAQQWECFVDAGAGELLSTQSLIRP
jgi:Zn-dependent metalloprotease